MYLSLIMYWLFIKFLMNKDVYMFKSLMMMMMIIMKDVWLRVD